MSADPTGSLPPDPDHTLSAAPPDGPTADHEPAGTASGPNAPAGSDVTTAAVAGPPPELPHVPGYELFDEHGRGGMGVVYRGRKTTRTRPLGKVNNKVLALLDRDGAAPGSPSCRAATRWGSSC